MKVHISIDSIFSCFGVMYTVWQILHDITPSFYYPKVLHSALALCSICTTFLFDPSSQQYKRLRASKSCLSEWAQMSQALARNHNITSVNLPVYLMVSFLLFSFENQARFSLVFWCLVQRDASWLTFGATLQWPCKKLFYCFHTIF